AAADLAVIDSQGAYFGLPFGDREVSGAVVAHEDHIVVVVDGVVLGERTAGAERVHDLHGLGILNFIFTGNRNSASGQETGAENDRANDILVFGVSGALVVVGDGSEFVSLHQAVERE